MHRLQAVAHIGQGAGDDDGHRIVEEGRAHLIFDVDLQQSCISGHTVS
jgi:hypothetical protein